MGGGHNHRHSLSDAVMVKDNHLAVLAQKGVSVTAALQGAIAQLPHTTHVEVEVDRLDQIEPVLSAGIGTIMLDNFSLADLRAGVRSEEQTSELQSLMRISYAAFCLIKKK